MSDHKRFGIDTAGLVSHIRDGVDSVEKVHKICSLLHTSVQEGLPSFPAHLALRQSAFGENKVDSSLPNHHSLSFCALVAKSYRQFRPRFIRNILLVLMILVVISSVLGVSIRYSGEDDEDEKEVDLVLEFFLGILEPLALLLIPVLMEAVIVYRSQAALKNGHQRLCVKDRSSMVKRGGELTSVKYEDIVVGDIMQLNPGDVVPADALLLQNKSEVVFDTIKIGSLQTSNGLVITAGSVVSQGKGEAVIVVVGQHTQLSMIANEPPQANQPIPVTFILVIATIVGLSLFLVMLGRFSLNVYVLEKLPWDIKHAQRIITFMASGISCFLHVIPLSLPLAIVWTTYRAKDNTQSLVGIFKFIQFKMTLNILIASALWIHHAVISTTPLFLSDVQQKWLHFFSILLALMLYPTDSANANIRPIRDAGQISVLACDTLKNIFGQVVWQLGLVLGLTFFNMNDGHDEPSSYKTMIFNCIAYTTLFHLLCVRVGRFEKNCFAGMLLHPLFCILWILTFLLQMVIVQYGGLAFHAYPLLLEEHLVCWCLAVSVFIWTQLLVCISLRGSGEQQNRACHYENNETEL